MLHTVCMFVYLPPSVCVYVLCTYKVNSHYLQIPFLRIYMLSKINL